MKREDIEDTVWVAGVGFTFLYTAFFYYLHLLLWRYGEVVLVKPASPLFLIVDGESTYDTYGRRVERLVRV